MKTSYLIALVALFLCSVPICAEQVVVSQSSGKAPTAITLRKTNPSIMMWNLGLLSFGGNTTMWQRDKDAVSPVTRKSGDAQAESHILPVVDPGTSSTTPRVAASPVVDMSGIDMVVPCDNERVLLVYGEKAAVERLKSTVSKQDVTPRQVQVKAELIKIDVEVEKKLGLTDKAASSLSKSQTEEIKTQLNDNGAEWVSSPVLSAIANVPAEISIESDVSMFQMQVHPKINADGIVTLGVKLSVNELNAARSQALYTQRRMADGESILIGGFIDSSDNAKELFVLLTPKVID